jgi:PleD family two-component response regulator
VNIAERLREALAMSVMHTGATNAPRPANFPLFSEDNWIKISVGIAAMQPDDTLDSIFSMSHMALYQAKAAGRNCIKVAMPAKAI